jgi:hypothetical protein
VEDSELLRSRRLLGLPLVILEPPPPPLRRKLDHQGSFEATGAFEAEQPPEESTANIGLVETSNTDTWPDIIVPIQFYERMSVPNPVMEPNSVTSSGNSSIPITIATTGEASPNLPLSAVRATTVSAATMSHSGLTPLSWQPHLFTHLVRQALHFHTVCLVQVLVLHSLHPLSRLWVWGQGGLTLLCKVNLGAFLSLSMIFLTLEVIFLLRPLRSMDRISSPPGSLHTQVLLEPGVKEHLCKLSR